MEKGQERSSALSEWQQKRFRQILTKAVPEKQYPLTWEFKRGFGMAVMNAEDILTMFEQNVDEWEKMKLNEASTWGRDAMDVIAEKAQRKRDELLLLRKSFYTIFKLAADSAEEIARFDVELEVIKERALHPNKAIREIHWMLKTLIERGDTPTYRQLDNYIREIAQQK